MAGTVRDIRVLVLVLAGALALSAAASGAIWPSAAAAQEGEDKTEASKAFYIEGRRAFDRSDWPAAIDSFQKAYALREIPKLLQFIASAYDRMGKLAESLEYLDKYAASSPEAAEEVREQLVILRPMVHRQMVLSASSQVSDAIFMATPGRTSAMPRKVVGMDFNGPVFLDVPYAVFTDPPGATVYINDKEWGGQGQTPYQLSLFPGRHKIWIEKDFFEPVEREVVIKPLTKDAGEQKLEISLSRQKVPVSIEARPENAEIVYVSEDGVKRTLAKGRWRGELPSGKARFIVQATGIGQRQFDEAIRLSAVDETGAQTFVFNVRVEEVDREVASQSGTLALKSALVGGGVYIDGQYVGKTPGELTKVLSPSVHRVELRLEGHLPYTSEVAIKPGEVLELALPDTLTPLPKAGTSWGGIVLTTLGIGAAAGGGVFTFAALDPETLKILGEDDQLAGLVLLGAGGALLTTGIILFAINGPDEPALDGAGGLRLDLAPTEGGWAIGASWIWP